MKPSALRIERLLAKVEAELACSARARRYVFHYDEVAEAEAQGNRRKATHRGSFMGAEASETTTDIRAMADGTLDSQVGARICNGLGIMRACLETQKLEQLESRMDEIAHRVARDRTNAARERTSTDEAQRPSH